MSEEIKFQIVSRKGKPYIRLLPYTAYNPTPAQKEVRELVRIASQLASKLTAEEVATLIGGEVAGKNLVVYEGRVLPTQAALTKWLTEGERSSLKKEKVPKWMIEAGKLFEALREKEVTAV